MSALPTTAKSPLARSGASTPTQPQDTYEPQEREPEALFYKPVAGWARKAAPSDNTRVTPKPTTTSHKAPTIQSTAGSNAQKLVTKLMTGIGDMEVFAKKIPGLGALTAVLRTATIVIPNIVSALASGDEAAVQRHCTDLAAQLSQAVSSLAAGGRLALSPEMLKVASKAAPVLGVGINLMDVGIDAYRKSRAPDGSEEEKCWEIKAWVDSAAGGCSLAEAVSGPLLPVSAGIALALAMASMLLGQHATRLREARESGQPASPPSNKATAAPNQSVKPTSTPVTTRPKS